MQNNLTPVVRSILIINVLIYIFYLITKFDLAPIFGLRDFGAEQFKPYQLVTYMFLHSKYDIMHLVSNMFGLFIFGPILEKVWGYDEQPTTRTVDNFIVRLRQKVEINPNQPRFILTVHGTGYKLVI